MVDFENFSNIRWCEYKRSSSGHSIDMYVNIHRWTLIRCTHSGSILHHGAFCFHIHCIFIPSSILDLVYILQKHFIGSKSQSLPRMKVTGQCRNPIRLNGDQHFMIGEDRRAILAHIAKREERRIDAVNGIILASSPRFSPLALNLWRGLFGTAGAAV